MEAKALRIHEQSDDQREDGERRDGEPDREVPRGRADQEADDQRAGQHNREVSQDLREQRFESIERAGRLRFLRPVRGNLLELPRFPEILVCLSSRRTYLSLWH